METTQHRTTEEIKADIKATIEQMQQRMDRVEMEVRQLLLDDVRIETLTEIYGKLLNGHHDFVMALEMMTAGRYEDESIDIAVMKLKDVTERCVKLVA